MQIFGNALGIIVTDSASLSEGSASLNQTLPVLNFIFDSDFANSNDSGSIAAIEASITTSSNNGVAGNLIFRVSDTSNLTSSGSEVARMFNSGGEARVGIGFNDPLEKPLTTLDVKSQIDSAEGTQIFLRSSRTTFGAQVGDSAGAISFLVDSASFTTESKDQFQASGSIAIIDSEVTTVDKKGVTGALKFNYHSISDYITRTAFAIGDVYGNGSDLIVQSTADRTELKPSSNTFPNSYLTIEYGSGSYLQENKVELTFITASITSDTETTIGTAFIGGTSNAGYYSFIVEYSLISGASSPLTTAGRTGQFMAVTNGGIVHDFTDFSTPSIGNESSPPILSCSSAGNLVIKSGSGYTFRGYIKRF
jgi:hypothetical protein